MSIIHAILVFVSLAQTPPSIDGKWTVNIEAAKDSSDSGRTRSRNASTGVLTLAVAGEKVTGTWQAGSATAWAISGTWKAGHLDLATEPRDLEGTQNGKKVPVAVKFVLRGSIGSSGVFGGTCATIFGNEADPLWTRWRAVRSPDEGVAPRAVW